MNKELTNNSFIEEHKYPVRFLSSSEISQWEEAINREIQEFIEKRQQEELNVI